MISRKLLAIPALCISMLAHGQETTDHSYEVVVYGGTASGVMTAISSARRGAKTVLIEPGKHLGGMAASGLSRTDLGNVKAVGGMAVEYHERLGKHYGEKFTRMPEPHIAEKTMNDMLKETSVTILLEKRLVEKTGVKKTGTELNSITLESGEVISGEVFVDCTYEGDLMAQAEVSYTFGREGADEFDEPLAGVRERTPKHQFTVPVSGLDANGELLPEIQHRGKDTSGSADKKVQAYNYRVCMTTNTENMVPFIKPDGYDRERFALLARLIESHTKVHGQPPRVDQLMHPAEIHGGKTDTNNNGAFSTDYLGGNWNYPDSTYAERDEIVKDHINYVAGFLYFLANDETSVPQTLRDEMNTWGLAKDEYADNNNWPWQLYVREARRMRGEYVMSQSDIQTSRAKEDVIGMGSYNSDSHNVQRILNEDGLAENEGDMQVGVRPYQIPYRCLLPKASEATNLIVPVTLSATHVAYSTLRMEPVYMISGHAAGLAAATAAKKDIPVHEVPVKEMQETLLSEGAIFDFPGTDL